MQKRDLKIMHFFLPLMLIFSIEGYSQVAAYRLKTADSLFQSRRYTQSFELYASILKQNEYSPAMLLRMAYIQEGLNHVGEAMYYINLYYLASHDDAVLDKMETLAEKHNLNGYKTTDRDRVLTFYHDNYTYISLGLGAILIFLLALTVHVKFRRQIRPIFSTVMVGVFVLVLGYHINLGDRKQIAIITNPKTYFMEGPSAAAGVVTIIGDGHRVQVIGKKDVWLKIKWDDQVGYVKGNSLLPVTL